MNIWPIPEAAIAEIVTAYWRSYYCADHCTLCGTTGILDTTGTRTPAGLLVGRMHFCLCPQGQARRRAAQAPPQPEHPLPPPPRLAQAAPALLALAKRCIALYLGETRQPREAFAHLYEDAMALVEQIEDEGKEP